MSDVERLRAIDDFWTRQFAFYLREHQHPLNRATHFVGIPLLIGTAVVGLATWNPWLIVGGQVVGWAIQILGHRIEGNKPALLKRPISLLMGPIMVLVEMVEAIGIHPAFARRAREALAA